MWYDSKDQPTSLEHIVSKQICADPEAVYQAEHPVESTIPVTELETDSVVEEEEEEEPVAEDHSHHHHDHAIEEEVEPI